jgi:hypothetical protein
MDYLNRSLWSGLRSSDCGGKSSDLTALHLLIHKA